MQLFTQGRQNAITLVHAIQHIGLRKELGWRENFRIKLFNQMSMVISLVMAIVMAGALIVGNGLGAIVAFLIIGILAFSLFFIHKGYYLASRLGSIMLIIISVDALTLVYGRSIGGDMTNLVMGLTIVVLIETWKQRIFLLLFLLVFNAIAEFILAINGPLEEVHGELFFFLLMFATNLSSIIIVFRFISLEEDQFEREVDILMDNLKERNHELEDANYELAQFASAASHHFKSPLKNITNLLTLAERKLGTKMTSQQQKYFSLVKKDASHLYQVVEDILSYSSIEGESGFGYERKTSPALVLEQLKLHPSLNMALANLEVASLPDLTTQKSHLELILLNLIQNGIRYNRSPQPLIRISGEVLMNGTTMIHVADSGIGIKKEYQEQIFDLFTRLHNQEEYEGTGVGLSICKKIMQLYGGSILVDSDEGKGAIFTLVFPAVEEA